MKNMLKCSSLIRVVVIMMVMAFLAGQVTETYATNNNKCKQGYHKLNNKGKCKRCKKYVKVIINKNCDSSGQNNCDGGGNKGIKAIKSIVGTYLCEGCVVTGEVCGFDPIPMVLQFHQDGNFTMNLGTFFERFSGAIQGNLHGTWKVVGRRPLTISVVIVEFDYDRISGEVIEIDKVSMSFTLQNDGTLAGKAGVIIIPFQIGDNLPDINNLEGDFDLNFLIMNCQRLVP